MGEAVKSVQRFVALTFGEVTLVAFYVGLVVGCAAGFSAALLVVGVTR